MSAIRINGIRVGHQMFHLGQAHLPSNSEPASLIYQTLAGNGINSPCLGVERNRFAHTVSCCVEDKDGFDHDLIPVCMISVYPHGSRSKILGFLLSLFSRQGIGFFHMVSSNAMISFVISQSDKARVLSLLEQTFDLPSTHTPYEPAFHEETAAFVKKRYQETRAYFQEQKIKTYGFALEKELDLHGIRCPLATLDQAGDALEHSDLKFYFTTALGHPARRDLTLYWLTRESIDAPPGIRRPGFVHMDTIRQKADLVSFHGPHFGDRFGIFNAAARCLDRAGLDMKLAGCTGASIFLVLPAGQGDAALPALERGFEAP